jgi:hypothetical protein
VITQPDITTQIHESTTTTEPIFSAASRATNEGQPDYRATTEAINRHHHSDSDERTYTPRHHDPMGRRARWRGRAAVIDSVSPPTSTTTATARLVASC